MPAVALPAAPFSRLAGFDRDHIRVHRTERQRSGDASQHVGVAQVAANQVRTSQPKGQETCLVRFFEL
jgi:hypothetical protein